MRSNLNHLLRTWLVSSPWTETPLYPGRAQKPEEQPKYDDAMSSKNGVSKTIYALLDWYGGWSKKRSANRLRIIVAWFKSQSKTVKIGLAIAAIMTVAIFLPHPTGGDLPKVTEDSGGGAVAYVSSKGNEIDFTHPQDEGVKIADFVYRIAKFNPQVNVLDLTIRYNQDEKGFQGFEKHALIDDLQWVRGFESKDAFAGSYGKYFANILFQFCVEAYNRSVPGIENSVATGDIDPRLFGQTREQFLEKAINMVPDLMRETGLNPAQQSPLNRTTAIP
jgi:hypothetical protein